MPSDRITLSDNLYFAKSRVSGAMAILAKAEKIPDPRLAMQMRTLALDVLESANWYLSNIEKQGKEN